MRATQANVCLGDSSHANEVIGTTEESRKGRSKRYLMPYAHTYCRRYQLLFCYKLLKEAIRKSFSKFFSIGRVANLTIQSNYIRIGCAKRLQRITISFACGNSFFAVILW